MAVVAVRSPSVRESSEGWMAAPAFAWWWPIGVFLVTRVIAGLFIAAASTKQIGIGVDTIPGYFVFQELPPDPGYFGVITNWDGQWYESIATDGYRLAAAGDPDTFNITWAWAFPPLFPLLVGLVMELTGVSFAICASIISIAAGGAGIVVLFKVMERAGGRRLAAAGTMLACCFVTAPLLQAAYSESLALLLLALSLFYIQRHQYLAASPVVLALSMTRLITPVLAVVIVVQALHRVRSSGLSAIPRRQLAGMAVCGSIAVAGAVLWSGLASVLLGSSAGFQRTALLAGEHRFGWFSMSFHTLGWSGLLTVVLGVAILSVAAFGSLSRGWGVELRTWSVAYPVYLLLLTPMHSGILRYLLLAPTLGLILVGSPRRDSLGAKRVILVVCGAAIGLALQWVWVTHSLAVTSVKPLMP